MDDGLHMADAEALIDPEVDDQAILAEYPDLINILMQLVKHPKMNDKYLKVDFNSADSVSYHLAGLIPLTINEKQNLLEAFDAKGTSLSWGGLVPGAILKDHDPLFPRLK